MPDASVANAWLTLKGEAKHHYETDAAFEAVRGLPGSAASRTRSRS